jgi:predicted nucleic acid-binding protein
MAAKQHRQFRHQKRQYVTTDYVLNEFISTLFRVVSFGMARQFVDGLLQATQSGRHRLVFVSPDQFHRAYVLRLRYHDKPAISFVDFTSMVVMQDLGLSEVFTGDAHFAHVGLGFRLVP